MVKGQMLLRAIMDRNFWRAMIIDVQKEHDYIKEG